MCLLSFAWNAHAGYPLVFAGNRDELHARPTAAAQWWADAPRVLGGRDLESGGSWLAMSQSGRFAVVTNFHGAPLPDSPLSRGRLVSEFVAGRTTLENFSDYLASHESEYAGFSLLYGDGRRLRFHSNYDSTNLDITAGIHGLSNHLLDTPWPKVEHLKHAVRNALEQGPDEALLLEALAARTVADTGAQPETGNFRSAPFIVGPEYGTRASTVILIDRDGKVRFTERNFDANGNESTTGRFEFVME